MDEDSIIVDEMHVFGDSGWVDSEMGLKCFRGGIDWQMGRFKDVEEANSIGREESLFGEGMLCETTDD